MAKHDASWWTERVTEFEETGDGQRIARTHGVTVKLLKWWRWRLRSAAPKSTPRRAADASVQRLLPVVVARGTSAALEGKDEACAAYAVIDSPRGRLSIRGALSPEQLAAVVAELVRAC